MQDVVHDRGEDRLQGLEDGRERRLGQADAREVVADPPLRLAVGHPRGLVQEMLSATPWARSSTRRS